MNNIRRRWMMSFHPFCDDLLLLSGIFSVEGTLLFSDSVPAPLCNAGSKLILWICAGFYNQPDVKRKCLDNSVLSPTDPSWRLSLLFSTHSSAKYFSQVWVVYLWHVFNKCSINDDWFIDFILVMSCQSLI